MSERNEKLELLGALVVLAGASDGESVTDEMRAVFEDARAEITVAISDEQYKLWNENNCMNLTFVRGVNSK